MPMFHAFVNVAVLPTLRAGGQVVTLPKFEPFSYVEALERYKVIYDKKFLLQEKSCMFGRKRYMIVLVKT